MKKILITSDAVGGVWTYTSELVRALAPHGVSFTVAVMGPRPSTSQRKEIESLGNATVCHAPFALEWQDNPWQDVAEAGRWLRALADQHDPDVIHLNGFTHAALPWDVPVLVAAHSCVLTWWRAVHGEAAPSSYAEYRKRVRHGLMAAACVVTPTTAFRESLAREYYFTAPYLTIANARNAAKFRPDTKEPVIFSAGRLWDSAKNLSLLARIAPRLRWPVHIAGDGSFPLNVPRHPHVLGRLSSDDIATRLGHASIFASPALYEPFGLAVLEAALSGCALVLADIPTFRELWDGCAVFLPACDDERWIKGLNELSADRARREHLQHLASRHAKNFKPEIQAAAFLQLYRQLHSTKQRSASHLVPA